MVAVLAAASSNISEINYITSRKKVLPILAEE